MLSGNKETHFVEITVFPKKFVYPHELFHGKKNVTIEKMELKKRLSQRSREKIPDVEEEEQTNTTIMEIAINLGQVNIIL